MLKKTALAVAVMAATCSAQAAKEKNVTIELLGTYKAVNAAGEGLFDEGAAEIVSHDPATQRLFVINAAASVVDVLDLSDPANPSKLFEIDVAANLPAAGGINSVAVRNGIVGVAVENDDKQADGWAAFYDTDGNYVSQVTAGALPDAITFTPNGSYALVANEGEPSDDYAVDPEGSITVIDLRAGAANATARQATFGGVPLLGEVRLPRPFGASVAQDLEPEYIATSHDSKTAWVSLQENNAVAVVDIRSATVAAVVGLGSKDHSVPGNDLDASNRDDAINITNWPTSGLFMPDSIAAFRTRGKTYLLTANEGDGREYGYEIDPGNPDDVAACNDRIAAAGGFNAGEIDGEDCIVYLDEIRVKDLDLDPAIFSDPTLQDDENLGRLKAVGTEGDAGQDGVWEQIYSYGARSITLWDTAGNVVWDSGDTMERVTAMALPEYFNSTNDENDSFDDRSDDKGPEPETAVVGKAFGRQYAFVGLERVGGIMIFDVTVPEQARYVNYVNNRNFDPDLDVEEAVLEGNEAGDLGPEGLAFIKADDSPTGEPLLVVGNEISGTTSIYRVRAD